MKRVCHIISGLRTGGAERSLFNLLAGPVGTRFAHSVISLTGEGSYGAKLREIGIPVMAAGLEKNPARGLARLYREVARLSPDGLQGWMYHGNVAALAMRAVAARRAGLAWNIRHSLYDIGAEKPGTRWAIRAGRRFSARPERIVYNSHLSRRQHEQFGYRAGAGMVIANGFDCGLWKPDPEARRRIRAALGIGAADPVVGFVARYHPLKDIPGFYAALAPVMAADTRLHCIVVGRDTGPENPALGGAIGALPAQRMHFLGERPDIPAVMAALDAFCLSSVSEAFPNVVGEAMACGLPCVATDVGDVARIVGETGLLVPPSEPARLAAALGRMMSMAPAERRALGAAARERIGQSFDPAATAARYDDLYRQLTGS